MAITTLDQLLAALRPPLPFIKTSFTGEAAGYYHCLAGLAGMPAAWSLGTPGMSGATVDHQSGIGGMFPWVNPSSGQDAYLARFSASLGAAMVGIVLFDLLWYQSGISVTTTTPQTINSVQWPARDLDGSSNGRWVEIWLFCNVATTNTSAITNTTISYTNSAGTSGRSGTLIPNWPATAVAGTIVPFSLQTGDVGVQSVQSITLGTSYGGGDVRLMAIRRIATIYLVGATSGWGHDTFACGMPRLFSGSALYLMVLLSGTAAGTSQGEVNFAIG